MKTNTIFSVLFLLFANTGLAAVNLQADPDKVLHRIDERIYGHFLEHIYHSVNGGLWGELVWNRSFEDNDFPLWKNEGESLVQMSRNVDQRFTFGDSGWTDFEYTLEARKIAGDEGFLILFRAKNDKEFYWANLGGWGNLRHGIERRNEKQGRQSIIGQAADGKIEENQWYKIRVRCEGTTCTVFLDDQKILEVNDPDGPKHGQCGVGTWATQAEYRNFQVKSLDSKLLFSEIPKPKEANQISKHWSVFGNVKTFLETDDSLNGDFHQQIALAGGQGGIQQDGFALKKGETYLVSFWVKHAPLLESKSKQATVSCGFLGKNAQQDLSISTSISATWTEIRQEITPDFDTDSGTLRIGFEFPEGETDSVCIDQISVMPKSWKEQSGGMRPDLLNAIEELRPPTIRWPGGCFASAYRWKSGIGAQHERIPYPFSIWDDREINSFGTDEFIKLCCLVDSEPIIVVNAGTPDWNSKRNPELANVDWPQEAADWVEYCNGPATSRWGKVRAENGHPTPYNVKYWEIDNETQGGNKVEDYIAIIRKMVPAMKKVDPSIQITVAGSHFYPRLPWDKPIIEEAGELFDYLSFHQYDDPNKYANGPAEIGQYFQSLKPIIAKSKNPNIKIFDSEWNAQSTDWRTGLYAGGLLNEFERNGDIVAIGGPALFLRHTSANDWDNAFVNFDQTGWFPAPNYVVMKLWREHYQPNLLELTGDQDGVNAVATKSDDGKRFVLKAVNPTNEMKEISLSISGVTPQSVTLELVQADKLNDRNTLANPQKIVPKKADVRKENGSVHFELPALSAGVLEFESAPK